MISSLKITGVNVRGLNSRPRCFAIKQWFRSHNPHILCMSETKLHQNTDPSIIRGFEELGPLYASKNNIPAEGTAILINKHLPPTEYQLIHSDSRSIIMLLNYDGHKFLLIYIYGHKDHHTMLNIINTINLATALNTNPVILIGDFNMQYHEFTSKYLPLINTPLMSGQGFFPTDSFSFYTKKTTTLIDLMFYTPMLHFNITSELTFTTFSDHLALNLDLKIHGIINNLNNLPKTTRILLRATAPERIMSEAYIYFQKINILHLPTPQAWFAFTGILQALVDDITKLSPGPKKMLKDLCQIEKKLKTINPSNASILQILDLKQQYKNRQKALAEIIATKRSAKFLADKQCWTRGYITWALGSAKTAKTPNTILLDNQTYTGIPLLMKIRSFLKGKFQKHGLPNINEWLLITNTQHHGINTPLIKKKIQDLAIKTHPGIHGIPTFIYQHLSQFTTPIIYNMLNHLATNQQNIPDLYPIMMVPFIKKTMDASTLDNIRPISMVPLIIKIIESLIKDQLQTKLTKLLHPSQHAKKGSSTHTAIAEAMNLIQHIRAKRSRKPIIIQLDITGAFDNVRTDVLLDTLKEYEVPLPILHILSNLLRNRKIHITLDGNISPEFQPFKSIPQGSPLSALLFTTYINPLINKLQKELPGIWVPSMKKHVGVIAYMDDITVFLPNKTHLQKLQEILSWYQTEFGLKINNRKSSSWTIYGGKPVKSNYTAIPQKFLGFEISKSTLQMRKTIENKLLTDLGKITKALSTTYISLSGKVNLLNMLIFPRITYYLSGITLNTTFIKKINKICSNMLWGKKTVAISLRKMQAPSYAGGLGLLSPSAIQFQKAYNALYFFQTQKDLSPTEEITPTDRPPPINSSWEKTLTDTIIRATGNKNIAPTGKIKYWEAYTLIHGQKQPIKGFLQVTNKKIIRICKDIYLQPKYMDYLIKLNTESLPTKQFLVYKRGFKKITPYCSSCPSEEESIQHIIYTCPFQLQTRAIILSAFKSTSDILDIRQQIHTGLFAKIRLAVFLSFACWIIRCRNQMEENENPKKVSVLNLVQQTMEQDRRLAPNTLFRDTWVSYQPNS